MIDYLNTLILEHLRYYGYGHGANALEKELKTPARERLEMSQLERLITSQEELKTVGKSNTISPRVLQGSKSNIMHQLPTNQQIKNITEQKSLLEISVENKEGDPERGKILKQEWDKNFTQIINKEERQLIFSKEELVMMKNIYVTHMEKSGFMNRNQFLAALLDLTKCNNTKLGDKLFLYATKNRSKILGPKIPLNCLSFIEYLALMENLSKDYPIKTLNYLSKIACDGNNICLTKDILEMVNPENAGIFSKNFTFLTNSLKHYISKTSLQENFTIDKYFEVCSDFQQITEYLQCLEHSP